MFKHKQKDQKKRMTEEEFIKSIVSEYGNHYYLIIERKSDSVHVFLGGRREK